MNHLEQIKVAFRGKVARQVVDNGVIKKYYRISFEHGGKVYHVSSVDDISGKCGTVMFIKKGELNTNGEKVQQDCFSLVEVTDANTINAAKTNLAELAAL